MKKVKKLTIILIILLLCLISFIGIYVEKQNIMENIVRGYDLGMNIEGYRELRMKATDDQEITSEKVEQVKEFTKKRLKQLGAGDYLIKANYTTGEIVLELEEGNTTDRIAGDIYNAGQLKIVDSEDNTKVLMTNDDVKNVSVKYNTTDSGTTIYMDMEFTEEGAKTLEELSSNEYKTLEDSGDTTTTEGENATEETKTQPKIALMVDGTELVSTSFDNPITTGRIQLSLNSATTNTEKLQEAVVTGNAIAGLLNNGPLPIKYELSGNTYVYSEITEQVRMIFVAAVAIIIIIALAVLIIKYKMPALLAGISYIGFIAVYLLVLRYANVVISLEGVAGILIILIINYLLIQKILKKSNIIDVFKSMGIQLVPVIVVILAFSFIKWTNIASFGMTMFWGILLTAIYHFVVTKVLLEK